MSSPTPHVPPTSLRLAHARLRRRGATLVEYALVLSAVAIPTLLGVSFAGARHYRDYVTARDHVVRSTP